MLQDSALTALSVAHLTVADSVSELVEVVFVAVTDQPAVVVESVEVAVGVLELEVEEVGAKGGTK